MLSMQSEDNNQKNFTLTDYILHLQTTLAQMAKLIRLCILKVGTET